MINALIKERVAFHDETSSQTRQTFPPNRNAAPAIQDYPDMTSWRGDRSLTSPADLRNKTDISDGVQPGGLAKDIPVRRMLLQSASQKPRNVSDLAVAGLPRRPVMAEC